MKTISDTIVKQLCEKCNILHNELTFLGGGREDSDGILYTFTQEGKKQVIKILTFKASDADELRRLEQRIEFAYYLKESGIAIAAPVKNKNGNLYETITDGDLLVAGYLMEYYDGTILDNKELTRELITQWGRMTGRAHRATKSYPVWKQLAGQTEEYGVESEIKFFMNWCHNPEVVSYWEQVRTEFKNLRIDRDSYGFIHNDCHERNILHRGDDIVLIDFDCAGCNFFMQDIIVPMQGIVFDQCGGFNEPIKDMDKLHRFMDCYLSGYEKENHIDDYWLKKADLFLDYRRLLLYTCMQDWVETVPELKKGFLHMMEQKAGFRI